MRNNTLLNALKKVLGEITVTVPVVYNVWDIWVSVNEYAFAPYGFTSIHISHIVQTTDSVTNIILLVSIQF